MARFPQLNRRDALTLAGGALGLVGAGFGGFLSKMVFPQGLVYGFGSAAGSSSSLAATPSCGRAEPTHAYEEGPFYTPNTPLKTDFRPDGTGGNELVLRGLVTDEQCRPIAGAVLDLWHANEHAAYDNENYDYRGHQFAAADGSFSLRTILPPPYSFAGLWRVPHIHVKVQGPKTRLLTTQIFLPDPSGVTRYVSIDRRLLARIDEPTQQVTQAFYHFVLRQS
jgi:protocatechuate 3,4-dioxygenase beta subunit